MYIGDSRSYNCPLETTTQRTRIATLDGWRGIAILLVLVGHFGPQNNSNYEIGRQGVGVFFILSGYLITKNLVREKECAGCVDLAGFYLRRFFRLMPCAWAMLTAALMVRVIDLRELAACVFCYRNFIEHTRTGITGHFWSLSIEEQFYLAWPGLLVVLSVRRARWVAFGLACAFAAFRYFALESLFPSKGLWTPFWADALLVGCFFSLTPEIPKLPSWAFLFSVPALAACIHRYTGIPPFGESILVGWMIHTTAHGNVAIAQKVLNWSPLARIGVMSYSLYVWQTPLSALPHSTPLSGALVLVLLCLFTAGSFYLIERPSRKLGARIARRGSQAPILVGA